MTLPLFYVNPGDIDTADNRVVLSGGEARHITLSLRAKPDDRVLVADGRGKVYQAKLSVIGQEVVTGVIESRREIEPELPTIVLYQAVARINKMDETVARAAESGISAVVPFTSPRSPAGSTTKALQRIKRWNRIAWEASKVARRAVPLEVRELMEWPIEKKVFEGQELNVLLWEDESSTGLREALPEIPPRTIGLVVGPEGGFESDEVGQLVKNGAIPATVGDLILRTETAGAYVAMLVRYNYHLLEPLEV
jgi:16S rRNA (uracil1498-N3)-methyltransferase